jgi:diguanylate cyclase (GGDEF)-like protein
MDDPRAVASETAEHGRPEADGDREPEPTSSRTDDGTVSIGAPEGWTDDLTGLDGPSFWDRTFEREVARVKRYRRPVTVALVELGGLDQFARRWGVDLAEEALRTCSRTLAGEIRSSDLLARIETARFALLLTETGEIAAINFVERARVACEHALRASGKDITIGFGWANPPPGGTLADAAEQAVARLEAELGGEGPG